MKRTALIACLGIALLSTGCASVKQAHLESFCSPDQLTFMHRTDAELVIERQRILESLAKEEPLAEDRGSMRSFEQNMAIAIKRYNDKVLSLQERWVFFQANCKGRV